MINSVHCWLLGPRTDKKRKQEERISQVSREKELGTSIHTVKKNPY